MSIVFRLSLCATVTLSATSVMSANDATVADDYIAAQRAALAEKAAGAGFGPQAPRDISLIKGDNPVVFEPAPAYTEMNLCNIHFHESAEHKGGSSPPTVATAMVKAMARDMSMTAR